MKRTGRSERSAPVQVRLAPQASMTRTVPPTGSIAAAPGNGVRASKPKTATAIIARTTDAAYAPVTSKDSYRSCTSSVSVSVLPLIRPALITCAIFAFIWAWNDFLGPLLYLTSPENYPLPIALRLYNDQSSSSDYGATVTASFIALLPVLLFFLVFQRFLVDGVATQGLKG